MLTERMAMRKMNEMCTRMALTLVFYVLLFHNCKGQTEPVTTLAVTTIQTTGRDPNDFTQGLNEDTVITNSTDSTGISSTDANKATDHSDPPIINFALPDSSVQQTSTDLFSSEATTSNGVVSTTVTESHSTRGEPHNTGEPHNSLANEIDSKGVKKNLESQPDMNSTTQANVFVPVLVTGLILAALLIGIYVWKNHCHTKKSAMKLAEDSYMGDEENQGNTLVSVAPLNPPENLEKPSLNGESLEVVKTQNPPTSTNGHSTAKADTEL